MHHDSNLTNRSARLNAQPLTGKQTESAWSEQWPKRSWMIRLWEVIEMAFPGDWMRRFPTDEAQAAAQRGWATSLSGVTEPQFLAGVNALSTLAKPPSLGEFRALCGLGGQLNALTRRCYEADAERRERARRGLTKGTHADRVEAAEAGLAGIRKKLGQSGKLLPDSQDFDDNEYGHGYQTPSQAKLNRQRREEIEKQLREDPAP